MFTFKFSESNKKTPLFELDGVQLRMQAAPGFLCIEYCGKSYRDVECMLELRIDSREYIFTYAFSMATAWFELPLPGKGLSFAVALDLVREKREDAALRAQEYPGLKNLGATCYINSLLQTLYYLPGFKAHLYKSTGYYTTLLKRLFYAMDQARLKGAETQAGTVYDAASSFIRNLSFVDSVHTHQDVHEFSKILFDKLENDNKKLKEFIEGTLASIVECDCGCVGTKGDPFQDIQLVLNDKNQKISDFETSLKVFCRPEELTSYQCEKHGDTKATKKVLFKALPDILFVLVNRFSVDWENDEFVKNNDFYSFPETVDFSAYIHEPADPTAVNKYKLLSVIVHSGGADEGHFYAYINLNGVYYKFNDNSVYQCCREEALDWNFGGKYAHAQKAKSFSAYYLVYIRDRGDKTFENHMDEAVTSIVQSDPIVSEPRATIDCKYLANQDIIGYSGPGRFNVSDRCYPMVSTRTETCFVLDNVAKLFNRHDVFDSSFKLITDAPVSESEIYFIIKKDGGRTGMGGNSGVALNGGAGNGNKGKLLFIKAYSEVVWCTYPQNMCTLGAFFIDSLDELKSFTGSSSALLFKEKDGKAIPITNFSELEMGDVVIISEVPVENFLKRYFDHELIHISVNGIAISSIFVQRGLSAAQTETAIQEYVGSEEIFIVNLADNNNNSDREAYVDSNNTVRCLINAGAIFYTGVQCGVDINHISHVHPFLLPEGATAGDLIKQFRLSKFICMAQLQTEQELEVVESFKESVNATALDSNDLLVPSNSFFIIQRKIDNPIKVSFYTGNYALINYPFLIENPGSIKDLREKFFFGNKIVLFDGVNYRECFINDILDLRPFEILLIEQD